ncbi:MAG: ABC transporter permease [Gemmatimonadota bacterium]
MSSNVTIVRPRSGWRFIDWQELREYGDLFYFLVWKEIKVRYAQSILGVGWAVIQPVFSMIVFTIVFSRLAGIESDGAPYAVFSFAALVPWTYFSNAVTDSSTTMIQNSNMVQKIYFPRMILPIAAVLGKLVDFAIALVLLFGMLVFYGKMPNAGVLLLPVLAVIMVLSAAGIGLAFSAMSVQYRDVRYALAFIIQLAMYAAPVVYPASYIPDAFRLAYAVNPMVGVIEGFRSALLGTNPMPWDFVGIGAASSVILFLLGALYFHRVERYFADVS